MTESIRIRIDPDAMPEMADRPGLLHMFWSGSIDDLIRFIYGNQGPLFVEDARLYSTLEGFVIHRDNFPRLVRGSWEEPVIVHPYNLSDDDLECIEAALDSDAERMHEQQNSTHDYTDDDLRIAASRRERVLRAIGRWDR